MPKSNSPWALEQYYTKLFPCKDCKDRHLGCHDACSKYLEAKEKNAKMKETIQTTKERESLGFVKNRKRR